MKSDFVIENIRASVGERAQGFITVDESAAGIRTRIPIILLNGAHEGPTLMIASGVHGDDLNTIPMVWRIAESIDLATLYGQVIAAPIINPLAFEAGTHLTPTDHSSPVFPGDAAGTISQRIGHHIYNKLVVQADYVIDMHGGSKNATLATLAHIDGGCKPEIFAKAQDMATAFQPQLIVVQESKPGSQPRGLAQAACRREAVGIYVGLGQMGFNEQDTVRGTAGVLNVMRHIKMLPGEPSPVTTPPHITYTELYQKTGYGGGFFPAVSAGQEVNVGDLLGTVFDVFGQPKAQIKAEVAGIVDAIRFYPVVAAGDWVASIARWESVYENRA
ncbi:MAG: succinylglutamate desuccinylase/aspartoacylase family protein [Anaerolineae bacterium]|nr:succinylglutamate desuccinylase/aspartoacylase family protein [Anaerolineae bacterium]MBN8617656.1 succinylglutamate desuccinylase/aspartoacylase family protein [Anaerolineae bacterium]